MVKGRSAGCPHPTTQPRPPRPGIDSAACAPRISPNGFADDSTVSLKAAPRSSPPPLRPLLPAAGPSAARPPSAFLAGRDAAPASGVRHPACVDATRGARSPRTGGRAGWAEGLRQFGTLGDLAHPETYEVRSSTFQTQTSAEPRILEGSRN